MMISSTILQVLVWILYIVAFSYTRTVNPIKYRIERSPLMNYRSSQNGNCSNTTVNTDGSQVCNTPQSSVLFDGVIPSLTGRNNNTCWASQLLVLNLSTTITFEFSDHTGIKALGIVMLNCDQENIGAAGRLKLQVAGGRTINSLINHISCNHLIRACVIFTAITANTITLSFEVSSAAQFPLTYYIAEMSFYDSEFDCLSSGIISASTSSTTSAFMDLETEPTSKDTEKYLLISSSTPNMRTSEDNNTNIHVPSITNFTTSSVPINTTSSVPIIIAVVALLFLTLLIVPIVIIITFRKRIRLTKLCSDLFSTTKIENCSETEKSSADCSRHEIVTNECNFDTYARVLEKKVEKHGRESVAAILNDPDPTELYAKVDTTRKKKPRAVEASSPDISEMYAVVNKEKKQRRKKGELNGNQDSSELYSVVDKNKKKKNLSNDNIDTRELYSVVNKAKIKKGEQEVCQL